MDGDKNVTAEFLQEDFTLTVTKDGNGTVTSNPAGIDCGLDHRPVFAPYQVIIHHQFVRQVFDFILVRNIIARVSGYLGTDVIGNDHRGLDHINGGRLHAYDSELEELK